jgi:hypothetical protein
MIYLFSKSEKIGTNFEEVIHYYYEKNTGDYIYVEGMTREPVYNRDLYYSLFDGKIPCKHRAKFTIPNDLVFISDTIDIDLSFCENFLLGIIIDTL